MSNYGRNFEFRVTPMHGHRGGRYHAAAAVPIGAPVVVNGAANALDLLPVTLAAAGAAVPAPGTGGIAVFEYGPAAFAGNDPWLTTYSDLDTVPAGAAVQVINGDYVKVVLRNTTDRTFLNVRDYEGKTMVAGIETLAVGDQLVPGTGNWTAGYWAEAGVGVDGWLTVTKVDAARGEVEARLNF